MDYISVDEFVVEQPGVVAVFPLKQCQMRLMKHRPVDNYNHRRREHRESVENVVEG